MHRGTLLAWVAALSSACDVAPDSAEEIPASIRGNFGRNDDDAFYPTLGLEVDKDTLRYSEMKVAIVAGKMVGTTYQIEAAEVSWARQDKLPKKCKGTLARQGDRLLISMFESDTGEMAETCESALAGEWTAWTATSEFPTALHGTYGEASPYTVLEGLTVDTSGIHAAGGVITIEEAVAYAGRDDYLLLRSARFKDASCRGHVEVTDDRLRVELTPLADDTHRCPSFSAQRWTVDTTNLPKATISNGKVHVGFEGPTVTLASTLDQGLRCEQRILRTHPRSSTDAGRDRIPVGAGEVLMLEKVRPTAGIEACDEGLRNLAANQCQELFGEACSEDLLGGFHGSGAAGLMCPTHIVIGEATTKGRKVALLPPTVPNAVCFQMSGDFTGG